MANGSYCCIAKIYNRKVDGDNLAPSIRHIRKGKAQKGMKVLAIAGAEATTLLSPSMKTLTVSQQIARCNNGTGCSMSEPSSRIPWYDLHYIRSIWPNWLSVPMALKAVASPVQS